MSQLKSKLNDLSFIRRAKNYLSCAIFVLVLIILNGSPCAGQIRQSITIDDLVGRVQIPLVSLAPNGSRVAYLAIKALPRENLYEVNLGLLATDGKTEPVVLSQYRLVPERAFEPNTGSIQKTAGQLVWSPDSSELVYTTHLPSGMEIRARTISSASERVLLKDFDTVEVTPKDNQLELKTIKALGTRQELTTQPQDLGLLVKDEYRFYGPLTNPKTQGRFNVQHWKYRWGTQSPVTPDPSEEPSYLDFPEEWHAIQPSSGVTETKSPGTHTFSRGASTSPNGAFVAMVENSAHNLTNPQLTYRTSQIVLRDLNNEGAEPRVLVPSVKPRVLHTILGWSPDGRRVYYVSFAPRFSSLNTVAVDGTVKQIYKEESGFVVPSPSSEISNDRATVVLVRNTNVLPDELVKIDLERGVLTTLLSPNAVFGTEALPVVRFMPIECCDADFYGRLYLPTDEQKGKRYPLVFTNYISNPGFYASVGDEVPILALVANGIAVFAMNSSEANTTSTTGDFHLEVSRVEKPLRAMEWLLHKLTQEGVVDPDRCGLTGLSYGAEIAMHAYWKSKAFQTLSVATAAWEPMNYFLGGVRQSEYNDSRGLVAPNDGTYDKWRELSAGLNARADLPPLLLQSPDGEYVNNVEAWVRLRRASAQVEWYEYPNEGHVKRGPATKWRVFQRNLDWFRFWLKDEEDPDPSKNEQYARWRQMRNKWEAAKREQRTTTPTKP